MTASGFFDSDDTQYYVDPSLTTSSADFFGDLRIGQGDSTDDDFIYFDFESLESLSWDESLGRFAFSNDLFVPGDITATGCVFAQGAIAGTCPSDERFKKNISSVPSILDRLTQLRPVHFEWRTDEFPEHNFGEGTQLGLIAQEVEQVLPELVVDDEDGYKRVRYSDLPMLLLQAVREQEQENQHLRARIAELDGALQRLEAAVAGMER